MDYITIRQILVDDINNLQTLGRQTFIESFGIYNTKENLESYLDKAFSIESLSKELTQTNSHWYYAVSGLEKVGYLKINFGNAQSEFQNESTMEIERIYVLQEFQGKSIGKLLFEKAIAVARKHGVYYVWLGVWERNTKAITFYKKHGFITFGRHSFFLGDDEQTDLLMKLSL